jgi:transcription initiation factor TFIIA small subunit
MAYTLYRKSTLGVCLTETLDDLIKDRYLSQDEGLQILERFDKVGFT